MTLSEKLQANLSEIRSDRPAILHVCTEAAPWAAEVHMDANTALAVQLRELGLTRVNAPVPPGTTVRTWAETIAASVSGLREHLKLIEVDDGRDEALLRSDMPSKKGTKVSYYEVVLTGVKKAAVRRYEADAKGSTRREQVAFALTHEVLAKLADDITA